jgi:hypothetical protein
MLHPIYTILDIMNSFWMLVLVAAGYLFFLLYLADLVVQRIAHGLPRLLGVAE